MSEYLLEIKNLKKYYISKRKLFSSSPPCVRAVDGVSLSVREGEILGVVGESGCGKSTLGRTILRLVDPTEGSIIFDGVDMLQLSREELRNMRTQMQLIFQDPGASLNPRMTIGEIIREPFDIFTNLSMEEKNRRVLEMADMVGLSRSYLERYPHEFSGGQRQRVGIARALALHPRIVICDEPVSALDVSVRAQILNLIKDLQAKFSLTYIFISHDLSVVNHICGRVAVMYLGRIVELADKASLFSNPLHPYTQALLSAIPQPDPTIQRERIILQGDVPNPAAPPSGCHFHQRCPYATEQCRSEVPPFTEVEPGHSVMCWRVIPDPARERSI